MKKDMKRIGILGGGQLALMLAQSEAKDNLVFTAADKVGSCAFDVANPFTKDLRDSNNVDEFCSLVDVVTFDSEFLGIDFADSIKARGLNVFPSKEFVLMSGDRHEEKTEINRLGIVTANFITIEEKSSKTELSDLLTSLLASGELSKLGIVVKTRHGGYDGKGQWVLAFDANDKKVENTITEIAPLVLKPGLIIEGLVDFDFECSIIASRSTKGELKTWPLIHNIHKDSILDLSFSPIDSSMISEDEQTQAHDIVNRICAEHDYVGTICIELFHTKDGLIVNEIAPRVHNSGHLTIEGSKTSQFKNHINAIRGKALGETDLKGHCAMINIVGFALNENTLKIIDSYENVFLHWYGKEVRPKRKVGHITIVSETRKVLDEMVDEIKGSFK